MNWPYCGRNIENSAKYCRYCGKKMIEKTPLRSETGGKNNKKWFRQANDIELSATEEIEFQNDGLFDDEKTIKME